MFYTLMMTHSKPFKRYLLDNEQIFARHSVLTLEAWANDLGSSEYRRAARERARYYSRTGRLLKITRGIYAVVPSGARPDRFVPDPYLVAAVLRNDAILSHHAALDLLGVAHSLFTRFTYYTADPRRTLRFLEMSWHALKQPAPLARAKKTDLGVMTLDRQGVIIRATGPERTLVDGFADPRWVGGLEEHVESAAAMRDLDLDLLAQYLEAFDQRILYAAVGWFLEKFPEVAGKEETFLQKLEKHLPRQPLYLDRRRQAGRFEARWNLMVPAHLSLKSGFEGATE
jgi:predicted transcriptional regulator of viral defense system